MRISGRKLDLISTQIGYTERRERVSDYRFPIISDLSNSAEEVITGGLWADGGGFSFTLPNSRSLSTDGWTT